MLLKRCLLCFDLNVGYYTYAIIIVGLRLSILCYLYYYFPIICYYELKSECWFVLISGFLSGWLVSSIIFCFLAILGIVQENSIIIYPYIVIAIVEIVVTTITLLLFSILVYSYLFIAMFGLLCVSSYDLLCLISLFKKINRSRTASGTGLLNNYSNSNEDI